MSANHQSELLQRLVLEVQQQLPGTQERQLGLQRLVDEIMRSRRVCRPLRGQLLSGVVQEIYQAAREQLLLKIDSIIDEYNPEKLVKILAASLLNGTFQEVLDDDRLKRLALEAQQNPPQTQQRQYLLTELVNVIQLSNRFIHPPQGNVPRDIYELIYNDAVNRTLLYVFQKIDSYDPERGKGRFMNWVNFRLQMIFRDLVRPPYITTPPYSETPEPETQPPLLSDMVMECIMEDQDSLFQKESIRNYNQANFRYIFLARRVESQTWQEISEELNIPVTTLSSFYGRCIEKFAPIIKKYVQDHQIS